VKEIEIKLPVTNRAALRRRMRSLGWRPAGPPLFERNLLFDTPEGTLRHSDQLLRLRSRGRRWWLTWKGPPEPGRRHKVRPEIELELPDGQPFAQILGYLGYRPVLEYQKYRAEFSHASGGGKVLLDHTPIGEFLELEGAGRWIDRVAAELGFEASDYLLDTYVGLYFAWCRRQGRRPGNMIFPGKKSLRPFQR